MSAMMCGHGPSCDGSGLDCGPPLPKPRYTYCTVAECGRSHATHGYCHAHWKRVLRNGEPGPAQIGGYVT